MPLSPATSFLTFASSASLSDRTRLANCRSDPSRVTVTTSLAFFSSWSRLAGSFSSCAATGSRANNARYAIFIIPSSCSLVGSINFVYFLLNLVELVAGDLESEHQTRLGGLAGGLFPLLLNAPLVLPHYSACDHSHGGNRRGPSQSASVYRPLEPAPPRGPLASRRGQHFRFKPRGRLPALQGA